MISDLKNESIALRYILEVRTRLIYTLIVLFILLSIFLYYASELYTLLAHPLIRLLPEGHLIATQIISPFFVPFKLAFMVALLCTIPFFFYQAWVFIAPALYGHEKRLIWPFLCISILLFYAGILFAYFIIFPMLFHFLATVAPQGVILSPDINEYLNFSMKLLLVFGFLFEIPIVICILVATQLVTRSRLIRYRSYAIVGAFILGMFFAPPDVISQIILAIPIWLLYECGILLSSFIKNEKKDALIKQ